MNHESAGGTPPNPPDGVADAAPWSPLSTTALILCLTGSILFAASLIVARGPIETWTRSRNVEGALSAASGVAAYRAPMRPEAVVEIGRSER